MRNEVKDFKVANTKKVLTMEDKSRYLPLVFIMFSNFNRLERLLRVWGILRPQDPPGRPGTVKMTPWGPKAKSERIPMSAKMSSLGGGEEMLFLFDCIFF